MRIGWIVVFIGLLYSVALYGIAPDSLLEKLNSTQPNDAIQFTDDSYTSAHAFQEVLRAIGRSILPATVSVRSERARSDQPNLYPRTYEQNSSGSGFIISSDGYIVTNYHVIRHAQRIAVDLMDNQAPHQEYYATVIGYDEKTDLALLKIEPDHSLPVVPLGDSRDVSMGDWVIAIGNPYGLNGSMALGIVSSLGRDDIENDAAYRNYIQVDASINFGSSGGPLINLEGQVIGVNSMIYSNSMSNASVGIGFAIPINVCKDILRQILQQGSVRRGYLGVVVRSMDETMTRHFGLEQNQGVLVTEILEQSPAAYFGLKPRDVILSVNGTPIANPSELQRVIARYNEQEQIRLEILRDGTRQTLLIRLSSTDNRLNPGYLMEGSYPPSSSYSEDDTAPLGLELRDIETIEPAERDGYPDCGAVVFRIHPHSPASQSMVQVGDVIISVDMGREAVEILSASHFQEVMEAHADVKTFLLEIVRKPVTLFVLLIRD
jgi:serine protease Do